MSEISVSNRNLQQLVPNVTQRELDCCPTDKTFLETGSFGSVTRIKYRGTYAAVKHYKQTETFDTNSRELFYLARCCCDNIVKVFGAGPDLDSRKLNFFLMEFAECGSLYWLMHRFKEVEYTVEHILFWLIQCAKAVTYLHENFDTPVFHRDLKPSNLLLFNSCLLLKLCDFGNAKVTQNTNTAESGTFIYMAPEVIQNGNGKAHYNEKCDVYSLGIICWEMVARRKPFHECSTVFEIILLIQKNTRLPELLHCPLELDTLMKKCWAKDPSERPSMCQVLTTAKQIAQGYAEAQPIIVPLEYKSLEEDEIANRSTCESSDISTVVSQNTSDMNLLSDSSKVTSNESTKEEENNLDSYFLEDLLQEAKFVEPLEGDEESRKLARQHKQLLCDYVALRKEETTLVQKNHDLFSCIYNEAESEDHRYRIRAFCKALDELSSIEETVTPAAQRSCSFSYSDVPDVENL